MILLSQNNINITKNSYGTLVFNNEQDIKNYLEYLLSQNPQNILSNQSNNGFNSLASTKNYSYIDESNAYEFILDLDKRIQLSNNIIKLSNDNKHLFTININNVNENTIQNFNNELYNSEIMNRFSIAIDRDSTNFNIFNITDIGVDEYVENSDSVVLMRRKFWGKGDWKVNSPCIEIGDSGVGRRTYVRKVYALFMTVSYEYEYRNCTDI